MYGLCLDNIWQIWNFENLESEGAKKKSKYWENQLSE